MDLINFVSFLLSVTHTFRIFLSEIHPHSALPFSSTFIKVDEIGKSIRGIME